MKTETKVKPDNSERQRIFMQYLGQNVVEVSHKFYGRLIGCGHNGNIAFVEPGMSVTSHERVDLLTLNLKPLSAISDEDTKEVCMIVGHWHANSEKELYNEKAKMILNDWMQNPYGTATGAKWLCIQDYLRSRGYALPYMNWSVEDLIEFGIIKLIE